MRWKLVALWVCKDATLRVWVTSLPKTYRASVAHKSGPSPIWTRTKSLRDLIPLWALCGLLLVLAACDTLPHPAAGKPAQIGTFEVAACPVDLPEDIEEGASLKHPRDIVCGYVTVPEEHASSADDPTTPRIRLAVAIIKATGDQPAPDPLVIESGGPGGSTLASAPALFSGQFSELREARDLVFIEQRGTTYAEPALTCEEAYQAGIEVLGEDLTAEEKRERIRKGLLACRERLVAEGVNLSAYDTLENAADIPMVMEALGYEQFNLYGVSYATYLAQHIMLNAPGRLRSVILDSVVPMAPSRRMGVAQSTDHAFRRIFEACAVNPTCDEHYPDLERVFFDLVAHYNEQPTTIQVDVPGVYFPVDVRVTGDQLVAQLYQHIYHTRAIPMLPALIYALAEGDLQFVENLGDYILGDDLLSRGMYYSVLCAEGESYLVPYGATESVYPGVTALFSPSVENLQTGCAVWDVEPLPDTPQAPLTSTLPVLILSGELDPVTPPENGIAVAETMPNAYAYTFPGVGHGAFAKNACSLSIVAQFLDDPSREPDATCIESMELAFISGLELNELTLKPVTIPEYGIRALAPEGWHRPGTDYFVAPDLTVELVITYNQENDFEEFLDEWSASDSLRQVKGQELTWDIRGIAMHGAAGHLATAPGDDGFYMILAISTPENKGDLYADIFLPIVEAFER